MAATTFNPDNATGTLIFEHGARLTPTIRALLGALALDAAGASESDVTLPFSGESAATWNTVLAHTAALGEELGLPAPAAEAPLGEQMHALVSALAARAGAPAAGIEAWFQENKLIPDQQAEIVDLVELAQLVDDGHGLTGYRIEEYSVNVTDGQCHPWNPFESNFASQADAEAAAEEWLLENEDHTEAVIGRVVVVDNVLECEDADDCLTTIYRENLVAAPALTM
ncbi:hypothetical protein ACWV27_26260 (plasmid) [Massilia varians]